MGSGDVPGPELREWLAAASDRVVDYLDEVEDLPVASRTRKGDLVRMLGTSMREEGVSAGELLREFDEAILPAVTHWNHPSFHGYFAITSSGPGIVAELLAAGLNLNAMTWQASPAGTELEWVVTRQLAHLLGLPEGFAGAIHDTASVSTLTALAGARSRAWPDLDRDGMFGMAPGRIYTSEESHSSVEKAARVLGFGRAGVRRIPVDDAFRMRPDALARALREDGEAGIRPVAVVATLGTTSTTSMDPVVELLGPVREAGAWLHVDAAYGGPLAALPEFRPHFTGWEEADSIVVNPHKWLFTPVDCSVLWTRDPDELRAALSAVPEYLRDRSGGAGLEGDLGEATSDLMDTGIALGRRFRSLKLRFVLEHFGARGIRDRLRNHLALARRIRDQVEDSPHWELMAPCPMATVVFRYRPVGSTPGPELDRMNLELLAGMNASGTAFLSHTRLPGGVALRLSVGNLRTEWRHLAATWACLEDLAESLG